MQQAIVAARSVEGKAMPNPPVGAAIVGSGKIVGLGATQIPGQDHAEIVALKQAGKASLGAEMYVTLEPCAMCAGAIIKSRIRNIFFGAYNNSNGCVSTLYNLCNDYVWRICRNVGNRS